MILFDSDVTHNIEELGYDVVLNPDSGAEVAFIKGAHRIELYFEDGEWFVYSESLKRKKADEGYMFKESVGLSKKELDVINDILAKVIFRMIVNGG